MKRSYPRLAQSSFLTVSGFLCRHAVGSKPAAFADGWRRHYALAMEQTN